MRDGLALAIALLEVVALEHARHGVLARDLDELRGATSPRTSAS